ncbi:DUF2795 domain-containing protein [Allorhizocola rhizosphaerae]|uniref:DUF2795 domain-containing protein n=1 Tax=Allorhizocola rhizosphaerae TaxID=1872709 RepID=UPI001FE311CA|nr:DUF2795 domain-containing protein [Allorhizocola rhizosphaerae]
MDLLELLSGVDFPVSREDLVRLAQERGADNELIALLKSLPPQHFDTADQLDEALSLAR